MLDFKQWFRGIYLFFTDKPYYEQRKRYLKRQKAVRKKLADQIKDFCPWSGYYMHRIVQTMLEFYQEAYEAGDCAWSEEERTKRIAGQISKAVEHAKMLDRIEDAEACELLDMVNVEPGFEKWLDSLERAGGCIKRDNIHILSGLAYEYLVEKHTKAMYTIIGKHIWDWCD